MVNSLGRRARMGRHSEMDRPTDRLLVTNPLMGRRPVDRPLMEMVRQINN
jgi:hypothetical protein